MVNHPNRSKRPGWGGTIRRNMVTGMRADTFCTEASDLGFQPGQWPGDLATDMGNGQPFTLWSVSDDLAIYRQANGVEVLWVYNR